MKNEQLEPAPIPIPDILCKRLLSCGMEVPEFFAGVGNVALLNQPLLGIIASRSCPGDIFLQIIERVPEWIKAGKVLVSGFHSPLEQQVLQSALRRRGRIVKVLARGIAHRLKPKREECEAILAGNMLTVTIYPPTVQRTLRAAALERNRFVLALAEERCIPWVDPEGPLGEMAGKV